MLEKAAAEVWACCGAEVVWCRSGGEARAEAKLLSRVRRVLLSKFATAETAEHSVAFSRIVSS
jgi:hypothetical protein